MPSADDRDSVAHEWHGTCGPASQRRRACLGSLRGMRERIRPLRQGERHAGRRGSRLNGFVDGGRVERLRATYRLQINRHFPLADVARVTPYLAALGISHLYSSPLLAARSGSTHGYDVVDPTRLDPQRGSETDLRSVRRGLDAEGMGLLLDVVPNHMATSSENPAWEDVLMHGPGSPYAHWFDIDWDAPGRDRGHLVLPVLPDLLSRCLARGEITLGWEDGALRLRTGDLRFPLEPGSVAEILEGAPAPDLFVDVIARLRKLPGWRTRDPVKVAFRRRESAHVLGVFAERYRANGRFRDFVDTTLAGVPRPALELLLEHQPYRLVHWRRSSRHVNYRRFFEVNDLVAIRVEYPTVFSATHEHLLRWIGDGTVRRLRIDHVDGL